MPDWVTWTSFVVGVVGLIAAYYFWRRPFRSILRISTDVYPLTRTAAPQLQVRFREEIVTDPRLLVINVQNTGPSDLTRATFQDGFIRIWCAGSSKPQVMAAEGLLVGELDQQVTTQPEIGGGGGIYVNIHPRLLASGKRAAISVICSGDPRPEASAELPNFSVQTARSARTQLI